MRPYLFLFFCTFPIITGTSVFGQSLLQSGPMLGYNEQREVLIWVQTKAPATVRIEYTDSLGVTRTTGEVTTEKRTAYTAKVIADDLTPGYPYSYQLLINNEPIPLPYPTRFRAQPTWRWRGDPPAFTVALGSCTYINEPLYDRPGTGYGSEYEIFASIHERSPDLMLWLGDNTYLREPDWYTRTGYLHRHTHTRSTPEMQALLAGTHHYATWDDHDYGPNNSDRTWVRKDLAKEAFDLFWGNLTSGIPGSGAGITSTFRYHDTDFFLLDNRSFRTPNDQRRTDNKTVLGTEQLEWLIESLIFSDSPWKMVCIGGQVLNTHAGGETYANLAPDELAYLLRRITEENIEGVVFLTGDRHHTELSSLKLANGKMVHDITISSLTAGTGTSRSEINENRVDGTLLVEHNFGILTFSGGLRDRKLVVGVYDTEGALAWERELGR